MSGWRARQPSSGSSHSQRPPRPGHRARRRARRASGAQGRGLVVARSQAALDAQPVRIRARRVRRGPRPSPSCSARPARTAIGTPPSRRSPTSAHGSTRAPTRGPTCAGSRAAPGGVRPSCRRRTRGATAPAGSPWRASARACVAGHAGAAARGRPRAGGLRAARRRAARARPGRLLPLPRRDGRCRRPARGRSRGARRAGRPAGRRACTAAARRASRAASPGGGDAGPHAGPRGGSACSTSDWSIARVARLRCSYGVDTDLAGVERVESQAKERGSEQTQPQS